MVLIASRAIAARINIVWKWMQAQTKNVMMFRLRRLVRVFDGRTCLHLLLAFAQSDQSLRLAFFIYVAKCPGG